MKFVSLFILVMGFNAFGQDARNISEYNLSSTGLGLIHHVLGTAYDPVGYFPEGGNSAQKGLKEFALIHKGVTYHFANGSNMKAFSLDPDKYEPTYGGWCARAMVVGQKIGINPEYYTVHGRRLHFFVNKRAKRFFDRNVKSNEAKADREWKAIAGEAPRL